MIDLKVGRNDFNFRLAHEAIKNAVDGEFLPCFSSAIMVGQEIVDLQCMGFADREARVPLRLDHIFRVFSNTKLVTSCAALLLIEQGLFGLDDPIENYIPELANRRVLKPGATAIDETEVALKPITIRQIMTHTAGFGSGVFDSESLLYDAYSDMKVVDPSTSLAAMIDGLSVLPLAYEPGTSWAYSVSTDIFARLVEIVSGNSFDTFIKRRIFEPLGMTDTGFVVSDESRLVGYYVGLDANDRTKPGLKRAYDVPYPGAFVRPFPRLNAGMGLVSTLPDQVALIRSLCPGGNSLLRPDTLKMMMANQLPDGMPVKFPGFGLLDGKGFGLAGAVIKTPAPFEHPAARGEIFWGGRGGTYWWISPGTSSAGIMMTQREMGHPALFQFKELAYQALSGASVK